MAKQSKKRRIAFTMHEPDAKEVFLVGSFDDWEMRRHPMEMDEKGGWTVRVNLEPGLHEYLFVVDGEWREDLMSEARLANPYGTYNSVLQV